MGIFDRLGRVARSEVSELKRVLREGERARDAMNDGWAMDERERDRLIVEAEAELARGVGSDPLAEEIDQMGTFDPAVGAAAWGDGAKVALDPGGSTDPEIARGADLWGHGPASGPSGRADAAPRREARAHSIPREVREAYAALELPLGADGDAVNEAYRALVQRYHPDRHAQTPHLQQAATELTIRIRDARDRVLAWLAA